MDVTVRHAPKSLPGLHVPGLAKPPVTVESEFLLGQGPTGFVGLMGRVESGQVLVSAGGGQTGVRTHDDAAKAMVTIANLIGGLMFSAFVYRFARNFKQLSAVDYVDALVSTGLFVMDVKDAVQGPESRWATSGQMRLYADDRIRMMAPFGVSVRSGLIADFSAGFSTNVRGVALAAVSAGGIATLRAAYRAQVEGPETLLRGRTLTTVSARKGMVSIEGNRIRVGRRRLRSQTEPIARKRGLLDAVMEATRHIYVEAEKHVAVTVGEPTKETNGRVAVLPSAIVASAGASVLSVDGQSAALASGKAAVFVQGDRVRIGHAGKHAPKGFDFDVHSAQEARDRADGNVESVGALQDQAVDAQLQSMSASAVAGSLAGSVVGASMLVLGARDEADGARQSKSHRAADDTFTRAVQTAATELGCDLGQVLGSGESPAIDVTRDAIVLRVGKSSIKLTAKGIEIMSTGSDGIVVGATSEVVINGAQHAAGGPVRIAEMPAIGRLLEQSE